MQRLLAVLLIKFCLVPMASAAPQLDSIRTPLDSGETDVLEDAMRELAATADPSFLRLVNERLFKTSHVDRAETIERWAEDYPTSVYAVTAAAYVAIRKLHGLSDDYSAYDPGAFASRDRKAQIRTAREIAVVRSDTAISQLYTDYVPALDAWLLAHDRGTFDKSKRLEIASRLIQLAPNRKSVLGILDSFLAISQNRSRDVVELCLHFAEIARDYDSDSCMIEAILGRKLGNDLRTAAVEALSDRDIAFFDDERLDVLLWSGRPTQEDEMEILQLHKNTLSIETDFAAHLRAARRIAAFFDLPNYVQKTEERTLIVADELVLDDPLNFPVQATRSRILAARFSRDGDVETLTAARDAFKKALVGGSESPRLWREGVALFGPVSSNFDMSKQSVFYENSIAHSGHDVGYLLDYFLKLLESREAKRPNSSGGGAECRLIRVAIIADRLCRASPHVNPYCDPAKPLYMHVPDVLVEKETADCPKVTNSSLSELEFRATKLSDIQLPW